MGTLVRDVMKRPVVTIHQDGSLRELMDLLRQKGISGVPVVDDDLRVVGVISETDLIRLDIPDQAEGHDTFQLADDGRMSVERSYQIEQLDKPVSEVMTEEVLTISPDDALRAACQLFKERRIHRLVVMEGGEIAGIITPVDVVHAIADGIMSLEPAPEG